MNYKEALTEIENALEKLKTHVAWAVDMEALKVAKKALEIQIPKEPIYQYDGYADGLPVWDIWECPSCGTEFEIDYDKHKHCPECGQLIDWEAKE